MSAEGLGNLVALLAASPVVVTLLVLVRRVLRIRLGPSQPAGSGGSPGHPGAGVREPRRPLPTAGAGAVALPLPDPRLEDTG